MSVYKVEAKVVVIGPQNVGKTSLAFRFVEHKFNKTVSPTVGASFLTSRIHMEGTEVVLQIWDTAGQERFKSMTPMYYRNANAAILVFDLTCDISFVDIKRWAKDLLRNVGYSIVMCLVGNKRDLVKERKVSREEAEQYAQSINALFFETSALTNEGIDDVFLSIAKRLLAKSIETTETRKKSLALEEKQGTTSELQSNEAQGTSCC